MKQYVIIVLCCVFSTPALATGIKEIKTPGGITAWLVEEHSQPVISAHIAFRNSGQAYDPDGKEGRAAMTSALLMEGAGEMDAQAFGNALDAKAIQLVFSIDEDILQASLHTLSEHKAAAFSYLGMALTQPRFDDSAIARVADQTRTLLTQQDVSPGYRLERGWQALAYGNHPYGKPPLGTKESVSQLEKSDFQEMAQRYFTRENMIVAVVGDITESELAAILDTDLGALPAHYAPDVTLTDIALPLKGEQTLINQDIPQTMVRFGTQGIKREDPDYFNAYVMNYLIGGGTLTTRLGIEIREKRGLAYAVGSELAPQVYSASWMGQFSTRNEKVGEALEVLKATLRQFVQNGPTDKELQDAKHFLTGSFMLKLDSNAEMASFLISMQLHHLSIDYLDTRNARIEAVTKEGVMAMARRLIDPDKLLVVMVGNPILPTQKADTKP